jgi:beta-galactosidase
MPKLSKAQQQAIVPVHQRTSKMKTFLFGCPYYPEHWSDDDRKNDAKLMSKANVNVVRMAEFAWDRMEPKQDVFDFSIFDKAIDVLGKQDIDAILCTPTATPPRWLTEKHEDWMRVDSRDRRMVHGSRQQCCTNNPGFRAESQRITRVMAEHYAGNSHVIGWQTDNEMFCHMSECYCDTCKKAFQDWCKKKYGDIKSLNAAWGTQFWSQTYLDFHQIPLPYIPERPTFPNPGHLLDYFRFLSDGIIQFQHQQVEILRQVNPKWFITHNGVFGHIDYWKFAKDLDLMGVDIYPGFTPKHPEHSYQPSLWQETARAASGTHIIPEQQGGAGGQRTYLHETPRPGQMRLWTFQSIAHGADGLLHFRWRTCRFGAEIYWNGILDHDNIPRRRYQEFSQEGSELRRIGKHILGTALQVKAAILLETEQEDAHTTMNLGLPSPGDQRGLIYGNLLHRHLPAGLVYTQDMFDGLSVLFIPSFVLMDETLTTKLETFTRNGGIVVATARTATRNRKNQVIAQTPPGLLSNLFGMTVEEFGKLNSPALEMVTAKGKIPAGSAYEVIKLKTAKALAHWNSYADNGPHAAPRTPAITMNRFGKGKAIYIGTYLSNDNVSALLDIILGESTLVPFASADPYVEITCRHAFDRRIHFVLNHYPLPKKVTGLPKGTDLLAGKECKGTISLDPYGVAIIHSKPEK